MKKYIVKLNEEQRQQLEDLISQGKAAARKLMHARVLLKTDQGKHDPGWSDERTAEALEVGLAIIARIRQRLRRTRPGRRAHPPPSTRTPREAQDQRGTRGSSDCPVLREAARRTRALDGTPAGGSLRATGLCGSRQPQDGLGGLKEQ